MTKATCNWCTEKPVACVTRSQTVDVRPPYQGQTKMTRVVVIAACKEHKHRLVSAPRMSA